MTIDCCYLLRQIVPAEGVDMVFGEPVVEHQHHGPAAVPAGARLWPGDPTARSIEFVDVLQSSNVPGRAQHRTHGLELQTNLREDYVKFYYHREHFHI